MYGCAAQWVSVGSTSGSLQASLCSAQRQPPFAVAPKHAPSGCCGPPALCMAQAGLCVRAAADLVEACTLINEDPELRVRGRAGGRAGGRVGRRMAVGLHFYAGMLDCSCAQSFAC